MSAKNAFFKKVEDNAKSQQASDEAFKKDIFEFQRDTENLFQEIKSWFDGSPVKSEFTTMHLTEDGVVIEMQSMTLLNANKTLKITPEGFCYLGVKGSLQVFIYNPNRAPSSTKFSLHWKDSIRKLDGWTITHGVYDNNPVERIEFNQENFFKMIESFA
ncbi:hypothetical protein [Xenorhabdus bovienii]|uniref:hypothetical protein n=1 Tax=Xenorhabdus bovienii TaxID=40576 RepID=UPI0023B243BC|nr:hypothetical protein [Xenorhabdus bovienii]MDE9545188.1 hypothetical protein [Xenorhabdus bovienii]